MRIQSELCHINDNRAIVKVEVWNGTIPLGSCLGEGKTVISAEANATERLLARLNIGEEKFKFEQNNKDNNLIKKVNRTISDSN